VDNINYMKLSDLKVGECGIIKGFTDIEMSLKLMDMGCLPGEKIEVLKSSKFNGPMSIFVFGYELGIRKEEAEKIILY